MDDLNKKSAMQLPREVWSSIICQYIHTAGLKASLGLRCVNPMFDEEVMYALFILRVKNLRRSTKRLHIPQNIAFLQLQGFFAQKHIPQKQHKLARKCMLRAAGHDPHQPISGTCFSYRPGQPCPRALIGSACEAHDIINALIHAQDSHVFVWGTDKEYRDDIFGVTDARIWRAMVATYKNDHDRVHQILREMMAEDPVDDGVRFFNRCMLIATRTNNPSMIQKFRTEVQGQSVDNLYHRRRLGEQSPLHNCLNESIRLGHLQVFDALLEWDWRFASPGWTLHRYLTLILLESKHLPETQRYDFFSTLLNRTEAWRDLPNMTALLMAIGESKDQLALENLIKVVKTKNVLRPGEDSYHILSQPLLALSKNEDLDMTRIFLENQAILFPTMSVTASIEMRKCVLKNQLESKSPRTPLVKLIVDHSEDLLREKLKLMHVLTQPEVQKQKLETWAWLALKLDLKYLYNSTPPSSFGAILLRGAVSTLNVETVRFLVNNGVWLESDASTSQVYEDDEVMMGRLKSVQTLLARAGQGQFSERKTVETTFSCTVDRAPLPNKKTTVTRNRYRRVNGLGIARGVRDVIGTAELGTWKDVTTDVSDGKRHKKEVVLKSSIWPKTSGRSYAAVAANMTAKVTGGTTSTFVQKFPSIGSSNGSISTTGPMSPGQSSAGGLE